jgi:hypothetical protein
MNVNESWSDNLPSGIDLSGTSVSDFTDLSDPAIRDRQIANLARPSGSVNNEAVANHYVVHRSFSFEDCSIKALPRA